MTNREESQTIYTDSRYSYMDALPQYQPWFKTRMYCQGGNTPHSEFIAGRYRENDYEALYTHSINPGCFYKLGPSLVPIYSSIRAEGVTIGWTHNDPEENALINILHQKWVQADFAIGVTLGEGRESAHLIVKRLMTIAQLAKAVRHRNLPAIGKALGRDMSTKTVQRIFRRLKTSRDWWLELQFGWLPLMHDIYGASELLKMKRFSTPILRSSVSKRGSFDTSHIPSGSYLVPERSTVTSKLRGKVYATGEPSLIERLGLTDPLSIGWELVPFSFVADWFLPIGSHIEAMHNRCALSNFRYVRSRLRRAKITVDHTNAYLGGRHDLVLFGEQVEAETHLVRVHFENLPSAVSDWIPSGLAFRLDDLLKKLVKTSLLASTRVRALEGTQTRRSQ